MTIKEIISPEIACKLKDIPEQNNVVGPIVQQLVKSWWNLWQIMFGKQEWRVPKTPSASNAREKWRKYDWYPVDIAVFESPESVWDYKALLFIIECKQETDTAWLEQLDIYLWLEPHAKLGIWANNPDPSSPAIFLFKDGKGAVHPQKKTSSAIPKPNSKIDKDYRAIRWVDLIVPSEESLIRVFKDLLGRIVAWDGNVTRREEQLDQLCNVILLKLDSDKQARMAPEEEVKFKSWATDKETATVLRSNFAIFIESYPDIFIDSKDKELRFSDSTLSQCVDDLAPLNLVRVAPHAVSLAFQVLRSAALKQEEWQYFTPQPVIEAAIKFVGIDSNDIILDPACWTWGFLVECLLQKREQLEKAWWDIAELSRWAQLRLHWIDKDAIAIKLTKAIMQILGDWSAHCSRWDSVLTHKWDTDYPHLKSSYGNGRFTLIFTNPPFGTSLKIKASEAKRAHLDISDGLPEGSEMELGLAMFNRCYQLLKTWGKLCIVLPETYFFSPTFDYVRDWCFSRFKPIAAINVPMDAFQWFCRAKTNLYIFEKLDQANWNEDVQDSDVLMLNPQTCWIYKNWGKRFKVSLDWERTDSIDNQMFEHVQTWKNGIIPSWAMLVPHSAIRTNHIFVPSYYNPETDLAFQTMLSELQLAWASLGDLEKDWIIEINNGHGSPWNDQRIWNVPYIKVSDIRSLRVNVNPTNMVPIALARKLWKANESPLKPWDLISPNRASSNIGEFAILLPWEEQVVLTKEMFVIRLTEKWLRLVDPFYLLWAFSLLPVRNQWKRVTLMQTNREDVGNRYKEVRIPLPIDKKQAELLSLDFKNYFSTIATAKESFMNSIMNWKTRFIWSLASTSLLDEDVLSEDEQ